MSIPPISIEIATACLALAVLVVDMLSRHARRAIWVLTVSGSIGLLALSIVSFGSSGSLWDGSYVADGLSRIAKPVILLGAALAAALSVRVTGVREKYQGAYAALLLVTALGLEFLVSSADIVTLVVGLETSAVSLAGLVAIARRDDRALEAGIKYLVLGALSSGVLFYGLALLYSATGSTSLDAIRLAAASRPGDSVIALGTVLAVLGLSFKLSVAPMLLWTPDVYEGAPTPVAAFISVSSKSAGFVFAIRLFMLGLPDLRPLWEPILVVLAAVTMTVGNLGAIAQKSPKRLLAYSTISQAGYLLVGFVGAPESGTAAVIFYLLVYTLTNVAAFAVVMSVASATGSDRLDDYAGLARREPVLALAFTLALLSLAGIPPLGGFVGKFYLFAAAMQRGYTWLVILAALNSIVSLFYYLLVLKRMYMEEPPTGAARIGTPGSTRAVLAATLAGILGLGVLPGPLMRLILEASRGALGLP